MREISDCEFNSAISSGICVVDFMASWCQPCKTVAKILEKLETEFPDVHFYQVDVDTCPSVTASCEIINLPTVYIFWHGKFKTAVFNNFDKEIKC